jgi:long-chain acyl-CoA synthetase
MSSGCSRSFPNAQPALGYGLTETNAVGCGNFWSNYAAKPASTGRAQKPFVELAILGAGDAHLPAGERGEIAIRSAANIKCYWRNPEATRRRSPPTAMFKTGDIGYLDEDGYLFIVDRKKDIIIRGGENISPPRSRRALRLRRGRRGGGVRSADERLGEVPVAIIHRARAAGLDEEDLRAFLDGKLAAFKVPRG